MGIVEKILNRRSGKFYTLFEEVGNHLHDMNDIFRNCLSEEHPATIDRMVLKLGELEHANDITTHKLFIELGRNFITPYDREDIHALATSLDDIADYIYTIAKQRVLYGIDKVPVRTHLIVERYQPAIAIICQMLSDLKNPKGLLKLSVMSDEAKIILNDCEDQLDDCLTFLFSEQKDPIACVKLSDHFNSLQVLVNKSKDALNVMESIAIKYS